eukprot:CAMPEP_0185026162 /NCGR_PEP_ID=MMETSP1103-20130426/10126_1 /TAXON_ID=36769 /ORGANISM="Paraphysomonas bandaiensis, Strain Caron Lab Isolate" /LENGTH=650 /DNA_ID=CAMNT_0027559653 /DNA_START=421 /DNA_END=2376 /DNA_ORIENTATION=+
MDKHYRAYKGSSESHATEKAGIPINEEVLCTEHPGEMSKLICRDCFVLICRECATLGEHSGHRVELVMHVATSLRERSKSLLQQAESLLLAVDSALSVTSLPTRDPSYAAKKLVQSRFVALREALDRREEQLMLSIEEDELSRVSTQMCYQQRLVDMANQARRILSSAETLSLLSNNELCMQYPSVFSSLEALLLSPLPPSCSPPLEVPVILSDGLLLAIESYGHVGSPCAPTDVFCGLSSLERQRNRDAPSTIPSKRPKAKNKDDDKDTMCVIVSWRQPEEDCSDIVRYVVQRSVCDLNEPVIPNNLGKRSDDGASSTQNIPSVGSQDGVMCFETIGQVIVDRSQTLSDQGETEAQEISEKFNERVGWVGSVSRSQGLSEGTTPVTFPHGEKGVSNTDQSAAVPSHCFSLLSSMATLSRKLLRFRVQAVNKHGVASAWSASCVIRTPGPRLISCPPPEPPLAPFHSTGVLYVISTEGGTRAYSNPHCRGAVRASMSSIVNAKLSDPSRIVDYSVGSNGYNATGGGSAGQWVSIDIGEGRALRLSGYAIRSSQANTICDWELLGRSSGDFPWVLLHAHPGPLVPLDDSSHQYDNAFVEGLFLITPLPSRKDSREDDGMYREFKLVQKHQNARGTCHLYCSGIELYGGLYC